MRTSDSELAAYGALILAVIISVLLGDALPSPYASLVATAGTAFGVFAAATMGRLSYLGVGLVVVLLTVVAPIALVYTWGWQITASALAMGAQGVVASEITLTWLIVVPTLAGVLALWAHRHLTFRWSGR